MASLGPVSSMAQNKSLVSAIKKDLGILRAPRGAAQERRRRELLHRGLRWAIQIAFLAAFPGVWSAAFTGVRGICQSLGQAQPIQLTSFVALLIVLLVFTCVFGRFFCGFACAFGTLGDMVYALATPLRRLLRLDGKKLPGGARRVLQLLKYVVLVLIAWLCFDGRWGDVSSFSPWTAFAGIRAGSLSGISARALAVLGAIAVGMAFVERFFCQFLCPFGAVFSLLPVLPVSLFRRNRPSCAPRCNRCQDRCPVGVHPDRGDLRSGECIACGRCADGCPMANVSLLRIQTGVDAAAGAVAHSGAKNRSCTASNRPTSAKFGPGTGFRIIGTEVTLTLLKAGILAALCYAFA